jgi:flavin-dependent dehydrogenase
VEKGKAQLSWRQIFLIFFRCCPLPAHMTKPVNNVVLYSGDLKPVNLASDNYFFYATDTRAALRHLGDIAKAAGAVIQCDEAVESGTQHTDYVEIKTKRNSYRASAAIGCDGARSATAQIFNLSQNKKFLVGVEYEYKSSAFSTDKMHVFLDREFAPGYVAWVLPGPDGITQVGLAGNRGFKPDIESWQQKIGGLFKFNESEIVERRSGLIPVGKKLKNISHHRVLLMGDAAGIVSPLTAGGIFYALKNGVDVGNQLAQTKSENIPALLPHLAKSFPAFHINYMLRQIFEWNFSAYMLEMLFRCGLINAVASRVFFHEGVTQSPNK